MMRGVMLNVILNRIPICTTDAERSLSLLPCKNPSQVRRASARSSSFKTRTALATGVSEGTTISR